MGLYLLIAGAVLLIATGTMIPEYFLASLGFVLVICGALMVNFGLSTVRFESEQKDLFHTLFTGWMVVIVGLILILVGIILGLRPFLSSYLS